jgi:hypothetical protein
MVTFFATQALHTEDHVFMATFACFSPNDERHSLRLSQQQVVVSLMLCITRALRDLWCAALHHQHSKPRFPVS